MITIKVEGQAKLKAKLEDYSDDVLHELRKAVDATGIMIRSSIVKKIQRSAATGRQYGKHRASAPGEPPATDTGRLASSITFDASAKTGKIEAEVKSIVNYAAYLEYGTRKMAKRPSWLPSIEEEKPKFRKRLEAAVRKAGEQ